MSNRLAQRAAAREAEIAGVAEQALCGLHHSGPLLLVGDGTGTLLPALTTHGVDVTEWQRHAFADVAARAVSPWPADGSFAGAALRLPHGWGAFAMMLHAVAARLPAGAPLWIYGGNDEGIATAPKRLDGLFDGGEPILIKRRARVLALTRTDAPARGSLDEWREDVILSGDGLLAGPLTLASWPGLFAHGRLDPGTAHLLEVLPPLKSAARVLDFGCGAGVISAEIRRRHPDSALTLLDVDSLALHAARTNLPGAETLLSDGWGTMPRGVRYDLIVSNPPLHRGGHEDFAALESLVRDAPNRLRHDGVLIAVIQRTAGAGKLIQAHLPITECLLDTPQFQVWRGRTGR